MSSVDGDDMAWDFGWRIVQHEEFSKPPAFKKLELTSNKKDSAADQPPNFKKYPLRPEQLRSLKWMLAQEATKVPFWEEEVSEAVLGSMCWRAEGKTRRPVLVRGGIVADQVGYGKTAITLGLVDAAEEVNGAPLKFPDEVLKASIETPATLVVVPAHLMGQWPEEVAKFCGKSKRVVIIKDMSSFNNITVDDMKDADLVLVNFTVLSNDKYHERLARLAGANAGSLPGSKRGGRHFDAVYGECVAGVENRCEILKENRALAYERIEKDAFSHWNEEQRATQSGVGMRLDRKKSVYKKVSEEKTKVEVVVNEPFVENKQKRWGAMMTEEEAKALAEEKERDAMDVDDDEEEEEEDMEPVRKCKARSDPMHKKMKDNDKDPWGLTTSRVQKDLGLMKCPPLELFSWNRVVIDEFHYLNQKQDRARVLTLVLGLKSNYRWCLSGTPPHESFNDVSSLARLLGIHLGVPDSGQNKGGRGSGRSKADKDKTNMEKFSDMLDLKSTQWHMRRHDLSQDFLDRFVRQNIAEIDEIPQEEHINSVTLPPAERAIYLELETHLKSLGMNSQKAKKSKKNSKGDREKR